MAKLDEIHEAQSSECKHDSGFAGHPGKKELWPCAAACGSLTAVGIRAKATGWACFSCQVYICIDLAITRDHGRITLRVLCYMESMTPVEVIQHNFLSVICWR
jgi:hypothetical protein